jgi:phosphate transport system protein
MVAQILRRATSLRAARELPGLEATMKRHHTNQAYDQELEALRADVLAMGEKVGHMITASMRALVGGDTELARRIIELDDEVDRLEIAADERCLQILAKRQPVASDLRFITTAMKMVTDLERIGDMAVDVARRTLEIEADGLAGAFSMLSEMAEVAQAMLGEALAAFMGQDAAAARRVIERDATIDALYAQLQDRLVSAMGAEPKSLRNGTRLLSVAKYLERVGDHVTNLAEMVVFLAEGTDIRHSA